MVRQIAGDAKSNNNGEGSSASDMPSTISISELTVKNSKFLIGQWISIIDIIYRKPINGKKPTEKQFGYRDDLGDSCWQTICNKKLVDPSYLSYWTLREPRLQSGNLCTICNPVFYKMPAPDRLARRWTATQSIGDRPSRHILMAMK